MDGISALERLTRELPGQLEADVEAQARWVLRYVLTASVVGLPVMADPKTCPNCGAICGSNRSPYCGEQCREMAGFVRQFRHGLSEGWIFDPAKQVALGQVLWHVLGGGRPLRREIAPLKVRERAIKREGGVCQGCGAPATTVDHAGSGCNRPSNLRAVCDACCQDLAFGDSRVTEREDFQPTLAELTSRTCSPEALRVCDDADTWDWRKYLRDRG